MQGLSQDDAVELVRGKMIRLGEVCYDGGQRIPLDNVQHLASFGSRAAVAQSVGVIAYFENASLNVGRMLIQELLDVIPINRRATVISPLTTYGLERPISGGP